MKFSMISHELISWIHSFLHNPPPPPQKKKLSGSDILQQVTNINVTFGRQEKLNDKIKRKRKKNRQSSVGEGSTKQWKKKSIFFNLPYWESNLLRRNLDVMHIEKNVFDNIIQTLLNDREKSKDHI